MGLLDEAIREHLDLKRRRGADPAEIQRAEREALGPVRRGPEPVAGEEVEPATALPYDAHADEEWDELFDERDFALEDEEDDLVAPDAPTAAAGPRPVLEPQEREPARRPPAPPVRAPRTEPDDLLMDDELFADPPRSASDRPPHPAPGDETAEYRVEDALAADPAHPPRGEDPLEETPEFLQDTPDHDRLWFEQRPPRDFDFDK